MSGIKRMEEAFLNMGSNCPVHEKLVKNFKKFTSGSEFLWVGWCNDCGEDKVIIHGNNPDG